jgi:hypothetical protein
MKRIFVLGVALILLCPSLEAQKRPAGAKPPATQKTPPAAPKPGPGPAPVTAAPARTERSVPFKAGESLAYDVSWSSFVTAGTATVTVREKKPSYNSLAYYIVAEGRPTPLLSKLYTLYYKADTLLDAYTLLPQRGSIFSQESARQRMKVTVFDQSARKVHYEMRTTSVFKQDIAVPAYTQDALSVIYVLRAIPLKPGASMTIPVSDSGTTYTARINVGQREMVKTGLGELPALRITPVVTDPQGKPIGRALTLWLSDDARRLPLKMAADLAVGSFNLTLREVKGGTVAGR